MVIQPLNLICHSQGSMTLRRILKSKEEINETGSSAWQHKSLQKTTVDISRKDTSHILKLIDSAENADNWVGGKSGAEGM